MRTALFVAFHFPPVLGSSGIQRTLNFCRYLPERGWLPIVLTVSPLAYAQTNDAQLGAIPDGVRVIRTVALDASRHLAIRGRYLSVTANPDRFASWKLTAIPAAIAAVLRFRPKLVWATYPIPTALQIGERIARLARLPLVADFRDLMVDPDYPVEPATRRIFERIEGSICARAARVVTTTPDAVAMLSRRYAALPEARWACIRNGYNEDDFRQLSLNVARRAGGSPLRIVHAGLLDPADRDPMPFFQALSQTLRSGEIGADDVRIVLRASGHDERYRQTIEELGIGRIVELAKPVSYPEALAEMVAADGLLLFQGPTANHLVPAKLYEYLRSGRPIVALVDAGGESARLLALSGIDTLLPIADSRAIAAAFPRIVERIKNGSARGAALDVARVYSRQAQAAELARLFDGVADEVGARSQRPPNPAR